MSRTPRLLPLVAVAAVGVLAINAVENGPGIIGAARSFAEGMTKTKAARAAEADADTGASNGVDAPSALPPDASAAPPTPAPICAQSPAEIAKEAGLSPAELQVLQSLGARRGELDEREQGLDTQLALIQAAEVKVDGKIATMNALKADMQTLLGDLSTQQEADVDRMVKVFEAMKPADSAARFVLLTDDVRLPIAEKMKERALSAMLAKMPPPDATKLTEALAARYSAQANAAKAAINPPAVAPAASAAAAPPAKAAGPDNLADASAPASTAAKPAPPHHKPHTVHHPATLAAAKPAKPAAPASPAAAAADKPAVGAQASAGAAAKPTPAKPAAAPPSAATPAAPAGKTG